MSHESDSYSNHPGTQAMIAALQSPGPRPELAEHLQLFGQFVGSWDLERTSYAPDGTTATVPGEWHFGWVLDGRAVQDVWICPPRGLRDEPITPPGEWGTVIRFYDARIDAWRATWVGPASGAMYSFIAREEGDEIILRGHDEDGNPMRWIFSDVRADAFQWRSEVSADGGATWRLTIEMRVRRRLG
ncbi:MAG TPA: hypothetical protein VHR39_04905 [Propionibacteriaceae bacterium]|nr:hypothetical protein [Propionibacteriaceae bacterium]